LIDEKIKLALRYKTIAVVGLSRDPNKDSYKVAEYLKANGYRIIPVNPFADEILDEKCYKSLSNIPEEIQKTVEVVDIFRPSQDIPPIVEQAVQLKQKHGKPHLIWMQLGIINNQATELAEKAGLEVVMDRCMMIEHKRLKQNPSGELEGAQLKKMRKTMSRVGRAKLSLAQDYPDAPILISDENFNEFVQQYPIVVVDCWAAWCGPCLMVAPIIDSLAKDYAGKVVFGKLNVDENPRTAMRFGIMSIPTLLIMKYGTEVDRILGAAPRQHIESRLQGYLRRA